MKIATARPSVSLLPALLAALVITATPAAQAADGWQWLPALNDPAWKPDATLALTGSRIDPDPGRSANAWGLELALQCGLMQTPDRRIRTHLNYSHASREGTRFDTLTLSPRYTVPLGDGLSIGAGPSLGLFRVEAPSAARTLPGLGVAAGLNWRIGALLTGVDVGWHGTRERGGLDQDPLTVGAKIGFSF